MKPSPACHFRALPSLVCVCVWCSVARWYAVLLFACLLCTLRSAGAWVPASPFYPFTCQTLSPAAFLLIGKRAEVPVSAGGPFQGLRGAREEPGVMVAVCRVSVSVWAWG